MSDIGQTLVIVLIVLVAAAYVGRRAWRTLRPQKAKVGCASDCGCGGESASSGDWAKS
jgi:hypothetical protein